VPDFEQPIAIDRPPDLLKETVLDRAVIASREGVGLLARAHVPLPRRDDRGRMSGQSQHSETENAGCQHVGAIDHQG